MKLGWIAWLGTRNGQINKQIIPHTECDEEYLIAKRLKLFFGRGKNNRVDTKYVGTPKEHERKIYTHTIPSYLRNKLEPIIHEQHQSILYYDWVKINIMINNIGKLEWERMCVRASMSSLSAVMD